MTFNEMRLVKHLVETAREIAQDDRELLDTYEGYSTAACGLLSQS